MQFADLGLCPAILKALEQQGYTEPTAIQKKAIPIILSNKDLLASAATGTGKTASFVLPILERLNVEHIRRPKYCRVLILAPTRELALQIESNICHYGQFLDIKTQAVVGGVKLEPQKEGLIAGVDIVIATTGRLIDMIHQRAIRLEELEVLVIDEVDRMLEMGFLDDVEKILKRLPEPRQNLLFSATVPAKVRYLTKSFMPRAVEMSVAAKEEEKAKVDQWLVTVDKTDKSALLSYLIQHKQWQQALIFIRTKHGAGKLVSQLAKRGIKADSIHSDRSQEMRNQVLANFKSNQFSFLVSTDISARGIDIEQLERVVNYDLPNAPHDYIHRIGRTGRAGAVGEAISLVSHDDFKNLCAIESRLGQVITRKVIDEYLPKKVVPISVLNFVPKNKLTKVHGQGHKETSVDPWAYLQKK